MNLLAESNPSGQPVWIMKWILWLYAKSREGQPAQLSWLKLLNQALTMPSLKSTDRNQLMMCCLAEYHGQPVWMMKWLFRLDKSRENFWRSDEMVGCADNQGQSISMDGLSPEKIFGGMMRWLAAPIIRASLFRLICWVAGWPSPSASLSKWKGNYYLLAAQIQC